MYVFNKLCLDIVRKFSNCVLHGFYLNYFNTNYIIVGLSTYGFLPTCRMATVNNEITDLPLTLYCTRRIIYFKTWHIGDENASVFWFTLLSGYYCCQSKYVFTLYWGQSIGSTNTFFFLKIFSPHWIGNRHNIIIITEYVGYTLKHKV